MSNSGSCKHWGMRFSYNENIGFAFKYRHKGLNDAAIKHTVIGMIERHSEGLSERASE